MILTQNEEQFLKDNYERLEPIYQKVLADIYDLRAPLGDSLEERKKIAAVFERFIKQIHLIGQPKGKGLDTSNYE